LIDIKVHLRAVIQIAARRRRMKSILVPVGGSDTDGPLLETALAAARPFSGHLHFLHVHVGAGQAAANIPHTEFAMGPALANALEDLERKAETRSAEAAQHVRDFCALSKIEICDAPGTTPGVTASWHEEKGHALKRIMFCARHCDLVVVGRAHRPNGLSADFIERLLVGCGRPVLISNSAPPRTLSGTIMVCWRETAEAARAVSAAMPFLTHAKRVVVATVAERNEDLAGSAGEVVRHLAWNGVSAEAEVIMANGGAAPRLLAMAAQACGADLVVLGAYGHSHLREVLFGGCTQTFIRDANRPVLLMH
jgi:nucleotide-binding universal stress UspA family protein